MSVECYCNASKNNIPKPGISCAGIERKAKPILYERELGIFRKLNKEQGDESWCRIL